MPRIGVPNAPAPQAVLAGPFVGCRDTPDLAAQDPGLAMTLRNVYPPLPEIGVGVWSRPGFTHQQQLVTTTGTGTISPVSTTFAVISISSGTAGVGYTSAGANTAFAGVGTNFTTDLRLGDVVTVASDGTFTVRHAGINGQIHHLGLFTPAGSSARRLALATTYPWMRDAVNPGYPVGPYGFVDGGTRIKLVEYVPTAGQEGSPETAGRWVDRTSETMAGVAFSTDSPWSACYSTTFADHWILADGVNRPRKITTAWVCSNLTGYSNATYGNPVVYYGKMFFIDADRTTLVWSDENDPDTGYTGNNAWTLRQTNAGRMTALAATNDALYVFREDSITAVTGAANDDFQSAGTIDAISNTTGTLSPRSVCLVESAVWFLDTQGRPSKIEPGRGLVPLWADCAEHLRASPPDPSWPRRSWGVYDPVLQVVLLGRAVGDFGEVRTLLAFSARTDQYIGTWDWPEMEWAEFGTGLHAGTRTLTADNRPSVWCIGQSGSLGAGVLIRKPESSSSFTVDSLLDRYGGTMMPRCVVETGPLLGDPLTGKTVGRVTVETRNLSGDIAPLGLAVRGPESADYARPAAMRQQPVALNAPGRATAAVDLRNVRYLHLRLTGESFRPIPALPSGVLFAYQVGDALRRSALAGPLSGVFSRTGEARYVADVVSTTPRLAVGRVAVQADQTTSDYTGA